ncbi:MAG TPA: hypothetical protein PLR50_03570 [Candidatus Rifleibacterium sp.]|nr:hypothetical protein [Candidatus Rifleibacterium sp.]HQB82550.1 hypothetical protein [Candidatus Rifleibacterium sp.]
MIRSKLFASAVMLVFLVTMLLPGNLPVFGAEAAREKSGAEIFLKWFTIGAVAVGAAVGFASFGAAGLLLGPLAGAGLATLTGIFFQANPVDQWRAVFNKAPKYHNSNAAGMAQQMIKQSKNSVSNEEESSISVMEAEAAYKKAYKEYYDAVTANDSATAAEKAKVLEEAKTVYQKAMRR